MSRSEALGIIETRSGGTPAATTPSRIPGDSAFTWAEPRYTVRSSSRATRCSAGLGSAPIWIGASGHRSRTSNTSGVRKRLEAASAGRAMVSGGEVA